MTAKIIELMYKVVDHEIDPTLTTFFMSDDYIKYDLLLCKGVKCDDYKLLRNVSWDKAYEAAHSHAESLGVSEYIINNEHHYVSDIEVPTQV